MSKKRPKIKPTYSSPEAREERELLNEVKRTTKAALDAGVPPEVMEETLEALAEMHPLEAEHALERMAGEQKS